jgi:hypothetical protein
MPTALRRNTLITVLAIGLVIVVGLAAERRYAARTPSADGPAGEQPQNPERAANGSNPPPSTPVPFEASEPTADPTALKPLVIGTVKPWTEIARKPEYAQASSAERMAIRDLYWRVCVEAKIPLEQRESAYWQFVRSWAGSESGAPGSSTRITSAQLLREQEARVHSPVDAATIGRWCKPSP